MSISSASPLSRHPPPSVPDFKTWLDNRGAVRDERIDLIYDGSGSGWGVSATQDLELGTICASELRKSYLHGVERELIYQYVVYPEMRYSQLGPRLSVQRHNPKTSQI